MKNRVLLALAATFVSTTIASAQLTLLDQIGPDPSFTALPATGNLFASQDFQAAFDAFDIITVDDFTVAQDVFLTDVEAVLGFFNTATGSFNNVLAYRVEVYSGPAAAAADLVGDVGTAVVPAVAAGVTQPWGVIGTQNRGLVSLDIEAFSIFLTPGTYLLGVLPIMDFTTANGQVGVSESTIGALNAAQANPGTGFPFQYQAIAPANNAAYRISATPEPASLGLLALGALGLLRRRA